MFELLAQYAVLFFMKDRKKEQRRRTAASCKDAVKIAGEAGRTPLREGMLFHLVKENRAFVLKDKNNRVIDASFCMNLPEEDVNFLSSDRPEFEVCRNAGHVFFAVLVKPAAIAHNGGDQWCSIS